MFAAAPLMRGGNRHIALIGLEALALVFLVSLWWTALRSVGPRRTLPFAASRHLILIAVLLLSPLWLALIYLLPLPLAVWTDLPGRSVYPPLLVGAGIAPAAWLPASLSPEATRASLFAGIPLVAGFLAGYLSRMSQLRWLVRVVVAVAFAEVILGVLQIAGGPGSSLYFNYDTLGAGRPFGTFANPNHWANYVSMALAGYTFLAWSHIAAADEDWGGASGFATRPKLALWIGGGVFLVLGILLSRSRGAAFAGLPFSALACGIAFVAARGGKGWKTAVLAISCVVVVALGLVGAGSVLSRFGSGELSASASFRNVISSSTLTGAWEYWPWGAGWGTYAAVYPRFQPAQLPGFADHAHNDYVQMFFEAGIFSLLLVAVFLGLAAARAIRLASTAIRHRAVNAEEMTCVLFGLGLCGFLLHSLIEFNMHIPANAILAALLAGVYLRPLPEAAANHDRFA